MRPILQPVFPLLCALTAPAAAQGPIFSIDYHGPPIGAPDSGAGLPITSGDLLVAFGGTPALGPLPLPTIAIPNSPGGLGLVPGCAGLPPGVPCHVEVDALSFGTDLLVPPIHLPGGTIWFSVDAFAVAAVPPVAPNVFSEAPVADSSPDAFVNVKPMPPGPVPIGPIVGHVGAVDGDGLASGTGFAYPGTGLVEPNPPVFGPLSPGSNLDAINLEDVPVFPAGGIYFSLDGLLIDPLTFLPGTGSSFVHGATGADIVKTVAPGAYAGVWAPGPLLGLSLLGPDDIDAVAIAENGTGIFEPSAVPYDWMGGATDMVLFSVKRGSAVVGLPDSFTGTPIEPGDILTTPLPMAMGGVSPFPGILFPAEVLGLATFRTHGMHAGDELNALDFVNGPLFDCNGNGVEDAVDIAVGTSADDDMNGIPDECEGSPGTPFCFCPPADAVCGNPDPAAGCANSTGAGGLLTATGSTSIGADTLMLTGTGLPPGAFNILFMGSASIPPLPMGDGLRCAGGSLYRYPVNVADGLGTTIYTGVISWANANLPPAGNITPGSTWVFQDWYRDPPGPCGTKSNVTNAVSVTFML